MRRRSPTRPPGVREGAASRLALAVLLAASGAAAGAQEAPPPKAPPAAAARLVELVRIECDGPAVWRRKFAPTNFGVMLASEAGAALWQPVLAPLETMWLRAFAADGGGGAGAGADAARRRWLDHAGRAEIVVCVRVPRAPREPLRPCCLVRVHGDGRSDLDAMAVDLRALLHATAGAPWRDATAGDSSWSVVDVHGRQASAPRRAADAIELLLGDVADFGEAAALAKVPSPARTDGACLRVVVDGRAVGEHVAAAEPEFAGDLRALGLDALRSVELAIGTAGPHVQVELAATFADEPLRWPDALFPAAPAVPPLLHLVPPDGTAWKAGHFDWSSWWRALPARKHDAGKDPHADLLVHLHTDYLLLGSPGASVHGGFDLDLCLVWRTRDDAKLAAGFAAVQPLHAPWFEPAGSDAHDGVVITRYTGPVTPVHVAIGRGLLVLAAGDDGRARVVGVLDRAKAEPSAVPPASWHALLPHAPKGWNGLAEADAHALLTRQVPLLLALLAFVPSDLVRLVPYQDVETVATQLAELLDRFELRRLRTLTGRHAGRWTFRVFW